jgi:phenylpropionate dioxygenase-like ring-hydroxylating dioxygenase large terminal subunit
LPTQTSASVDGKLVGDELRCHYHGLRFAPDGRCVRIPGQDHISAGAKAKTYPLVERYHWIWIWMGDPARADPAAIPDFHWLDDANWGAKSSYLHVDANWQLIVDNLLDLTHLAFVHETTIGNAAIAENAEVKVEAERRRRDAVGYRSRCASYLQKSGRLHREGWPLADY